MECIGARKTYDDVGVCFSRGLGCDIKAAHQEEKGQHQDRRGADKSHSFGYRRINKVGFFNGHFDQNTGVIARKAAGRDRFLGLDEVPLGNRVGSFEDK